MEPQKDTSVQSPLKSVPDGSVSHDFHLQHSHRVHENHRHKRERGIVLFLSLIMLTSMTLIALSTFYNSMTQSKIGTNISNIYEQNSADDIARMVATDWLNNVFSPPPTCNSTANCLGNPGYVWQQGIISPKPSLQSAAWWTPGNGNSITVNSANGIACVSQPSQYVIEQLNCDQTIGVATYRVTTQSMGLTSNFPVYREYIVTPFLQPMAVTMFNRSCLAWGTATFTPNTAINTFHPSTNGNITAIWIGNGCWSSNPSFNITVSGGVSGSYTQNNVILAPASSGCGANTGTSGQAMSNMSAYVLPTPYPVLTSQTITISVTDNYNCGFHCVGQNPTNGTNCYCRMTVQGMPTNICVPASNAASVCP